MDRFRFALLLPLAACAPQEAPIVIAPVTTATPIPVASATAAPPPPKADEVAVAPDPSLALGIVVRGCEELPQVARLGNDVFIASGSIGHPYNEEKSSPAALKKPVGTMFLARVDGDHLAMDAKYTKGLAATGYYKRLSRIAGTASDIQVVFDIDSGERSGPTKSMTYTWKGTGWSAPVTKGIVFDSPIRAPWTNGSELAIRNAESEGKAIRFAALAKGVTLPSFASIAKPKCYLEHLGAESSGVAYATRSCGDDVTYWRWSNGKVDQLGMPPEVKPGQFFDHVIENNGSPILYRSKSAPLELHGDQFEFDKNAPRHLTPLHRDAQGNLWGTSNDDLTLYRRDAKGEWKKDSTLAFSQINQWSPDGSIWATLDGSHEIAHRDPAGKWSTVPLGTSLGELKDVSIVSFTEDEKSPWITFQIPTSLQDEHEGSYVLVRPGWKSPAAQCRPL